MVKFFKLRNFCAKTKEFSAENFESWIKESGVELKDNKNYANALLILRMCLDILCGWIGEDKIDGRKS